MAREHQDIKVDASEAMQNITIKVTGFRVMAIRWAIASALFRLAGAVAGTQVIVKTKGDDGGDTAPRSRNYFGIPVTEG